MGFILVEQTQTSVEHTKFSLLYFVEHNQTMPEWKYMSILYHLWKAYFHVEQNQSRPEWEYEFDLYRAKSI